MSNSMIEERLTKEQLSKLPVWAQRHFEMIERALASSKAMNDTLRAALGEAPLDGASGLVTWSMLMDDYLLPDTASVRFHEGGKGEADHHRYIEVGLRKSDARKGNRIIYVQASGSITIQPLAGNVVAIRLLKRGEDD